MKTYYNLIDKLFTYLSGSHSIHTVTFGDLLEVDLSKQSIFPLAHVGISSISFQEYIMTVSLNVIVMDMVDEDKEDKQGRTKPHLGLDNTHDIHNSLLNVVNGLQSSLRRGGLYDEQYEIDGTPVAQIFEDRFENKVTGWSMEVNINIPNNDMALINADGTQCQPQ
jgi:hypothetical protein